MKRPSVSCREPATQFPDGVFAGHAGTLIVAFMTCAAVSAVAVDGGGTVELRAVDDGGPSDEDGPFDDDGSGVDGAELTGVGVVAGDE